MNNLQPNKMSLLENGLSRSPLTLPLFPKGGNHCLYGLLPSRRIRLCRALTTGAPRRILYKGRRGRRCTASLSPIFPPPFGKANAEKGSDGMDISFVAVKASSMDSAMVLVVGTRVRRNHGNFPPPAIREIISDMRNVLVAPDRLGGGRDE